MSNKSYGLSKEREVKGVLYKKGALFVERQRGSFGGFDVTAYFKHYCLKVSVKATKQKSVSFKKEIEKLKKIDVPKYCKKELWVYWSPNKNRKKKGWEIIEVI